MSQLNSEHIETLTESVNTLTIEVRTFVAEQRAICRACQRQIDGLSGTVFGNGTPGLKISVDRLLGQIRWVWLAAVGLVGMIAAMFLESVFGKP